MEYHDKYSPAIRKFAKGEKLTHTYEVEVELLRIALLGEGILFTAVIQNNIRLP